MNKASSVGCVRRVALGVCLASASLLAVCMTATVALGAEADAVPVEAKNVLVPDKAWDCGMPEGIAKPEDGTLVFEVEMTIDQVYDVGKTQYGERQVIVVAGGKVTGEKLQATVMSGGLDFQLDLSNDVVEIEQILVLRTGNNQYIYARYAGVGPDEKGVRLVLDFEAPNGSPSAWLNTAKLVGTRAVDLEAKTMTLKVYDVAGLTVKPDVADAVKIAKPEGVPAQPWDFRKKGPTEKAVEQLITENVALGGSQSVGTSKRGGRNIIPITGGTLTGKLTGKVLPGGADYQNLANPMTIDARYLWQTDDGEVIIVRNAGPFGSLVPTFEAKADGKYAWLNTGTYLSSNPGMGAGGVSLTFQRSE